MKTIDFEIGLEDPAGTAAQVVKTVKIPVAPKRRFGDPTRAPSATENWLQMRIENRKLDTPVGHQAVLEARGARPGLTCGKCAHLSAQWKRPISPTTGLPVQNAVPEKVWYCTNHVGDALEWSKDWMACGDFNTTSTTGKGRK